MKAYMAPEIQYEDIDENELVITDSVNFADPNGNVDLPYIQFKK